MLDVDADYIFAIFTPTIPLPAALWLGLYMFMGMGAVGAWQKRKRAT